VRPDDKSWPFDQHWEQGARDYSGSGLRRA